MEAGRKLQIRDAALPGLVRVVRDLRIRAEWRVAVVASAQRSCGHDSCACLVGVEELAAEPTVLVQVTTGHLESPYFAHVAGPSPVEPRDGDEPLDGRGRTVVVGGVESTARRGVRFALLASESAPSVPNALT